MFHMMNEARIGVGAGATALGYTGYLKSLAYARARTQGRPVAAKDPAAPQVPIIDHPDVRRMLLAQKAYAEGALALMLYCADCWTTSPPQRQEADRGRTQLLLEVLTPIAKSWPSQWCLAANDLAIQVHGGYGYTREYDVEQHYRDNRLNPIHEGTHGIQGLDLLGRKVVMYDGAGLELLRATLSATAERARAASGEAAGFGAQLQEALDRIMAVTARIHEPDDSGATARAGERLPLSGGRRAHRAGLDLAGAVPGLRQPQRTLPPGQTTGHPLLLPLRTPAHRAAVRPSGGT